MTQSSIPPNLNLARKWRVFRSMDRADRIILMEALMLPVAISWGFRLLGVSRTQAWLRRCASVRVAGDPFRDNPRRGIVSALRAQRLVKRKVGIGGTCLVRSLTLWTMLLRRGVETHLRVGIRKTAGKFEAHAWMELDGEPVNESIEVVRTYDAYPKAVSFDGWRGWLGNIH